MQAIRLTIFFSFKVRNLLFLIFFYYYLFRLILIFQKLTIMMKNVQKTIKYVYYTYLKFTAKNGQQVMRALL